MKKLLLSLGVIGLFTSGVIYENKSISTQECTPAERVHDAIVLYADSFGVPLKIAFNIAYLETTYRGPQDSTYNHRKVSNCGAVGVMQLMPKYASHYAGFKVLKQELKDNIELNIMVSMKMLSSYYKRSGSWKKAAGKYHTGKFCIDSYAVKAVKGNYQEKWI